MKKIIGFIFCLLAFTCYTKALDSFEGSISFMKQSKYQTSYYTCFIKGNMVRMEESNKKGHISRVFLIDTELESIFMIDAKEKIYSRLTPGKNMLDEDQNFMIIKSENLKLINGILCQQWRVRNTEKNSEVAYWVAPLDYDFFQKFIRLMNRTDHEWKYFWPVQDAKGYFPMMAVERNLVRDEKMRTVVLRIEQKLIESTKFVIPADYKALVL